MVKTGALVQGSDDALKVAAHFAAIGKTFFERECWIDSEENFRKALMLAESTACYHRWLGDSLSRQKRWNEAQYAYRSAVRLNPYEFYRTYELSSANAPSKNAQQSKPVFIVGCGHSGTSLMLAILSNHSQLHSIPSESALFTQTDKKIKTTMRGWDLELKKLKKKRWVEKTPPHVFHIDRLLAHRPKSKFILMIRDGRDVACSLRIRSIYKNFDECIDRWVYDNLAALPHWGKDYLEVVKYENLITQTESTLRKVCDFIEEDYNKDILNYHATQRLWYSSEVQKPTQVKNHQDHMLLRNWQINQPIFDGRGRWRQDMDKKEAQTFKLKAQKYLEKFDYVDNENW